MSIQNKSQYYQKIHKLMNNIYLVEIIFMFFVIQYIEENKY